MTNKISDDADIVVDGTEKLAAAKGGVNYGPFISSVATYLRNLSIHGADIASASTVNLETATGDLVDVTGTTTITAITLSDGHRRIVRFTGILTLTNGASLVLPGGANITTAAGDYAVFAGYAAGVVRCVEYSKATGKATVLPTAVDLGAFVKIKITILTSSGTWTRDTNCIGGFVRALGSGAGGGAAVSVATGNIYCGGGGQSGGYAEKWFNSAAAIGSSQTITIGAAGTGGSGDGTDGADCSFGSLVIAKGGQKGTQTSSSTVGLGGFSTTAGTGDFSTPGGRGGAASWGVFPSSLTAQGDGGSLAPYSSGARSGAVSNGAVSAGGAGQGMGGGGAGGTSTNAASTANGGGGSTGGVIVVEFLSA